MGALLFLTPAATPLGRRGFMMARRGWIGVMFFLPAVLEITALGSENVPHRPYAMWADIPDPGQFILGMVYEESEAYHIWAGRTYHNITVTDDGEDYGIDVNQGYFALQYGI